MKKFLFSLLMLCGMVSNLQAAAVASESDKVQVRIEMKLEGTDTTRTVLVEIDSNATIEDLVAAVGEVYAEGILKSIYIPGKIGVTYDVNEHQDALLGSLVPLSATSVTTISGNYKVLQYPNLADEAWLDAQEDDALKRWIREHRS